MLFFNQNTDLENLAICNILHMTRLKKTHHKFYSKITHAPQTKLYKVYKSKNIQLHKNVDLTNGP